MIFHQNPQRLDCTIDKFRTSLVQVWWVEEEISSKAFGNDDGVLTMIMIIFVYVAIVLRSTCICVVLMIFDPFGFQRGIYRIWLIHFDCSQYRVRVFYWGRYPRTNTTGLESYSTDNPRDQSWKRTVKSILFSLKHISIQWLEEEDAVRAISCLVLYNNKNTWEA